MKKGIFILIISLILLISIAVTLMDLRNITGRTVSEHQMGPTAAEQTCMMQCMGCSSPGVGCTGNQELCTQQCNLKKPEQTAEEKCVETCTLKGCDKYDFDCQSNNQEKCDKECGMLKDRPDEIAMSEEQKCISQCVAAVDSTIRCQSGEGGEKGNEVCQRCAKECEHLYAGPCLGEEKLEQKKQECQTCEHCYGELVMGDSGEGYECIVDIQCKDASGEFGDNPGTGAGVVIGKIGDAITESVKGIVDFFKGIFGIGDTSETTNENANEQTPESVIENSEASAS